jgi:hypothetical protein
VEHHPFSRPQQKEEEADVEQLPQEEADVEPLQQEQEQDHEKNSPRRVACDELRRKNEPKRQKKIKPSARRWSKTVRS